MRVASRYFKGPELPEYLEKKQIRDRDHDLNDDLGVVKESPRFVVRWGRRLVGYRSGKRDAVKNRGNEVAAEAKSVSEQRCRVDEISCISICKKLSDAVNTAH